MTADEINAFWAGVFPGEGRARVEAADGQTAVCRLTFDPRQIRPGGTLSGPTMMALADTCAYALVLSAVGFRPLAVTTNLSINFMRKPAPEDLLATGRMLKLGRALAVMDVALTSGDDGPLVAQASVTYSIPRE